MRICPRNAPLYGGEQCDEKTAQSWCSSMRDVKWCEGCERDTYDRRVVAEKTTTEQGRLW